MASQFVHLHLHTEYSLADGLVRIKPLMKRAKELGMPAIALTDLNNLFALVKFYRAAISQGIKPLIGIDAVLDNSSQHEMPGRVVLLCQNEQGYKNLTRLVTRAYLDGIKGSQTMLRLEWLEELGAGLIVLSGGREGDIGHALLAGDLPLAEQRLAFWTRHFPNRFFLELQRTGREHEEVYIQAALQLAESHQVPVVASNDVRYLQADDFEAHEVRVCIQQGRVLNDPRRSRNYSPQQYLRSAEEMASLFEDIPEALENSVEIAKRCNVSLTFGENVLPEFPVPEGMTVNDHLRQEVRLGLEERFAELHSAGTLADSEEAKAPYLQRMETELEVIINMGYPGYFLIVADFIRWARQNRIPVGPGRGSGAGSVVAYALRITDLDPLAYDLLFERFLNPERVSMPDFDIDFCMDGRDRVIDYVADRYGRDRVSQIITYGSMAAKAVVRDVGRVLGHPYGFVDRIAKLIPFAVGMTLEKALSEEAELRDLYEQEEDVQAVLDMAKRLEGLARNAGKHAGGVVISPTALTDFTPLYCEPGGQSVVTQLDKDDVEAIGLVKFDFLGLRTLTIIDKALDNISQLTHEPRPDLASIPLDDAKTYALLQRKESTAVFQLESRGIKEILKRLKPDCFEDVVALVALYRPGPLQSGMVDDFIDRKHGAKVEYPHPDVEPILSQTYGVILYQEQVMQIAQVLAGYTLGGADLLRRAMGKKKPEEMAKQRTIFMTGAIDRGVDESVATYIFDLMEKFAGYGFNKSHSVAYALLAYQTAWLKAHYPAAFMASVLSADMDNTDKVVGLIDECRTIGLKVLPPNVNQSQYAFTVPKSDTVLYGLGAIKGVGQGAIEAMISQRNEGGEFRDLCDLCLRCGSHRLNRRLLEALIRAGALDELGESRAALMANLPQAIQLADQEQRNTSAGQNDLFGEVVTTEQGCSPVLVDEWSDEQRLMAEKEVLGLFLTGHPINRYAAELKNFIDARIGALQDESQVPASSSGYRGAAKKAVVLSGLVMDIKKLRSSNVNFLTLDDGTGRIEVSVSDDKVSRYGHLLRKDKILIIKGTMSYVEFIGAMRVRADEIMDMDQARCEFGRSVKIRLADSAPGETLAAHLQTAISPFRNGHCPVSIEFRNEQAVANLQMGDDWNVEPSEELLMRLQKIDGIQAATVEYR